jgi:hypothetical protein
MFVTSFITSKFSTPKLAPRRSNSLPSKPSQSKSVGSQASHLRRSRSPQSPQVFPTAKRTIAKTPSPNQKTNPIRPLQARSRSNSSLQPLPNQRPVPQWLNVLKQAERGSLILAAALAGGAIVTYGWAMYSQQQWGTEYRRLDQLRRNERQLTTNGELMKNNIARSSDPKHYGLVPRSADHIVVIPPSNLRAPLPMRAPGPDPQAKPITPVGY